MDYTLNRNIETLNNNVSMKRKALATHLMKSQARKNDYKIVRGVTIVEKPRYKIPPKANLKAVSRDFESLSKSALNSNDDIGMKPAFMVYDGTKTAIMGTKKLNAVSRNVVSGAVKVSNGTSKVITIAGKSYRVAENLYAGYKTGTFKGTLNMYRNMTMNKVASTIRYSKPVYHTRNFIDGTKRLYLKASYRVNKDVTFVKGVAKGNIKITPQMARKYAVSKVKAVGKGTWKVSKTTVKGANKFAKSKVTGGVARNTLNGIGGAIKSVGSNSDDIGLQASATAVEMVQGTYRLGKATYNGARRVGRGADKTVRAVGKVGRGFYVTGRGIIRFGKDIKKIGFNKTSKIWYKAHMKGAGKKVTEKIGDAFSNMFKTLLKNPIVLTGVALLLGLVILVNSTVTIAAATVGGVVEFFEELAEGLVEVVETVVEAIADFLESCVDWLAGLFGFGDDGEVVVEVDVDIGDSMSICDYLLGTVQLYKAEYSLEITERRDELLDEGYHEVLFYNYFNDGELEINDYRDVNGGLMADKDYVINELPVWKAVIFGRIGSDFTAEEANAVAKLCFISMTAKKEEPYVDLNGDGEADYHYCDGSTSLHEGENHVVVKIGDAWIGGLQWNETYTCYNLSEEMYHSSHNTDGIDCCVTKYYCGGHMKYMCNGHSVYCWEDNSDDFGECSDYSEITVTCDEEEFETCDNKIETIKYCWTGYSGNPTECGCNNYTAENVGGATYYVCNGHDTVYCDEVLENWIDDCDNHSLHNETCFSGQRYGSEAPCDNCSATHYWGNTYIYTCNGHEVEKCDGHTPYECGGHIKYICNGHGVYCWEGWADDFGSCTDYRTWEQMCYYGSSNEPTDCTTEYSEFHCDGYTLCKGHKLMKFYLGSGGFNFLLDTMLLNRITELEAKVDLTDEEREELSQLQMQYEYASNEATKKDPVANEWYDSQP